MLPPISKLNDDILWLICLDITEFQKLNPCWPHQKGPSPLTNLLNASQVCASWRTYIVESSPLWARVVDVNALHRLVDAGRREILRRAEESSLHVQVVVCRDESLRCFAKLVLVNEWHRIRSLDMMFVTGLRSHEEFEKWHVFQTAAPKLQHLYVDCTPPSRHTYANTFELFDNRAPQLRSFSGISLQISPGASWLSNLRSLRFTSSFTASELLSALQQAPLLEDLQVFADVADGDVHSFGVTALPQVFLSRLKYIAIHTIYRPGSVPKYLDVLAHIVPPAGCVLFLPNLLINPVSSDLQAAYEVLQIYFPAFLRGLESPVALTLHAERNSFQLFSGSFGFDISCSKGFPNPSLFLEALSSPADDGANRFSFVKSLKASNLSGGELLQVISSLAPSDPLKTVADGFQELDSLRWSTTNIPFHLCVQPRLKWPSHSRLLKLTPTF